MCLVWTALRKVFSMRLDMEAKIRAAVAEISDNYRIDGMMREKADKRLTIGDVVYTHGSREVKPGTIRKPGTRRQGKSYRKPRWAAS